VAGFYLVMRLPVEELRHAGWLLTLSEPDGLVLFRFPLLEMWNDISWQAILFNVVTAVTLIFTAFISMLLNVNAIEMAVGKDMTPNRELRLAGVANLVAILLGGGIVGYPSAGLTIMAYKRGQPGRLMGLVVSGMFGAALFYGFQYLEYLPKFVIGGLLISLGINFLYEWLIEGFFKFSRTDYLVVLAMFFAVTFFDLLAGVVLGLVLMVIIFVLNYSKTNVIRSVLTGKNFQSNVDRPMKHMEFLRERGEQLLILRLQGYIFFGTAHTIYQYVKDRLEKHEGKPLRFVVIDFTQTYGIDSSAAMIFTKMRRMAEANNISLAFTSLDQKALKNLEHNGFVMNDGSARAFENMDYAVEWCESVLLAASDMTVVTSRSLVENLGAFFDQAKFRALFAYMTRFNAPEGHIVVQQGNPVPGLYLIERGRATVYREMQNGQKLRIRTLGAGTVIGETGLYTGAPASATVIIDVPSEIYLLTPDQLAKMEVESPALASNFHHYIVQLLGQRLQYTTTSVQALLE
jgi:SulP family sulfate permease